MRGAAGRVTLVCMPYRIDVRDARDGALDRLVELGALDVDTLPEGGVAALMPDGVASEQVAEALGVRDLVVSPAVSRDAGSIWLLGPRVVRVRRIVLAPVGVQAEPGAVRVVDSTAFGTGLHPTTALCIEALDDVAASRPDAVLDVGTGSGVLALAALRLGVRRALAIDVDEEALRVAAANARLNGLVERLELKHGGPETLDDAFPLVLANILAAPLIEMASVLVRRVGHHGRLVLSGIPSSVEADVHTAYRRLGMRRLETKARAGWVALVLQASW